MGEEITEEEFEMMIETLTELSPALLKRARDAARAKAQRADDRSMKMRKLGKGPDDSNLTKKLDKEQKEGHKQGNLIRVKKESMQNGQRQTNLTKGQSLKTQMSMTKV